LAMWR